MKKCPECNTVFEDSLIYCNFDGSTLIEENFILPSEVSQNEIEEETVIHHEPIKVEIPTVAVLPEQIPVETKVVPVIIETSVNRSKYIVYWALGLIVGIILATGILLLVFFKPTNSNNQTTNEIVSAANNKHLERNQTRKDSEFNGFVLSENANIRSAPSSSVVESLPKNDRLNILERDGAWYRVICEHGVNGWMHGNTIRFKDDAAAF